jgi:hypothetical protein
MGVTVRHGASNKWRLIPIVLALFLLGIAEGIVDLAARGAFKDPGEVLSLLAGFVVSRQFFIGIGKMSVLFAPLFLLFWATEEVFVLSREGLSVRRAWRKKCLSIAWAEVSRLRFALSFAIPFRMVAGLEVTGAGPSIRIPLGLREFPAFAEAIPALCPGAEIDAASRAVLGSLRPGPAGRPLERQMLRAVRRYVKDAGIGGWLPIRWMRSLNEDPRHREAFLESFAKERAAAPEGLRSE